MYKCVYESQINSQSRAPTLGGLQAHSGRFVCRVGGAVEEGDGSILEVKVS